MEPDKERMGEGEYRAASRAFTDRILDTRFMSLAPFNLFILHGFPLVVVGSETGRQ